MANTQDIVRRLVIQAEMSGQDQVAEALRRLSGGQEAVTRTADTTEKGIRNLDQRLEGLARRVSPTYAEMAKLGDVMRVVEQGFARGGAAAEKAGTIFQAAMNNSRQAREEAQRLAQMQRELARSVDEVNAARQRTIQAQQGRVNTILEAADPVGQGRQRREQDIQALQQSFARGTISAQQFAAATQHVEANFERLRRNNGGDMLANGAKLAATQWTNLGFQVNDVITSLASGMPLMM